MKKGISRSIRKRLGPVGISLAAAAITAAGFAAFSIAAGEGEDGSGEDTAVPAPPPGPGVALFRHDLSAEDRQKMEEFRQCMEDNGAPAPPRERSLHVEPGDGDERRLDPRKPPSSDEIEKIKEAFEACKSKLPEELQEAGFPPHPPCGPPPGAEQQRGENQEQGFVVPASAPSGT
jgi:hypothetical protein